MGSTKPNKDPTAIGDPDRMDVDQGSESKTEPNAGVLVVPSKDGKRSYELRPVFKQAIEACAIKIVPFIAVLCHTKDKITLYDSSRAFFVYVAKEAMASFTPMVGPQAVFGLTKAVIGLVNGREDCIVALLVAFEKCVEIDTKVVRPTKKSFAARYDRERFFCFHSKDLFVKWADGEIQIGAAYDGIGSGVNFRNAMKVYFEKAPIPSNVGVFAHVNVLQEFVGKAHPNGDDYVDLALSIWSQCGNARAARKELERQQLASKEDKAQSKRAVDIAKRVMAKVSISFRDQKHVNQLKYGPSDEPSVTAKANVHKIIDEYSPLNVAVKEIKLSPLYIEAKMVRAKRRRANNAISKNGSVKYDFGAFKGKDESKSEELLSVNGRIGKLIPRDVTVAEAVKRGGYRKPVEWDAKCREMVPAKSKVGTLNSGEYASFHSFDFYIFQRSLGSGGALLSNILNVDFESSQLQRHRTVILSGDTLKETNEESVLMAPKTFINSMWSAASYEVYQLPFATLYGEENGIVLRYDMNAPIVYASMPLEVGSLLNVLTGAIGSTFTTGVRIQPNLAQRGRYNRNRVWDFQLPFDVDMDEAILIIHNGECTTAAINQRNTGDYSDYANVAKESAKDVMYGKAGIATAAIFTLQASPKSKCILKFGGTSRDFRAVVFFKAKPLANQMNANALFFEKNNNRRRQSGAASGQF